MRTATAARARRLIGRMAAVALVALFLSGQAAAPAGAMTHDDGRNDANDFISWCVLSGGDPIILEANGDRIEVICYLPNGDAFGCEFYPYHECYLNSGIVIPGHLSDVRTVPLTNDPGSTPTVDAPESVAPVVAAPAAEDHAADTNTPTSKKSKHGKHGKHGKGHKK
jgi:hypothetical protein